MIKKRYYWKEISSDGLLKEPVEFNGWGGGDSLNDYGHGFETEADAFAKLESIGANYSHYRSYTLVAEYRYHNGWNTTQ